ncbi:hypothetical protein [Pseudoruminococcus massiliensis]|uniref:hypothetical protein n=1 Tax=Pseudoruminococcus massiliensis TaxID=2086583 RepID=UPI003FD6E425
MVDADEESTVAEQAMPMRGKFIDVVEEITNLPIRKLKVSLKPFQRLAESGDSVPRGF